MKITLSQVVVEFLAIHKKYCVLIYKAGLDGRKGSAYEYIQRHAW